MNGMLARMQSLVLELQRLPDWPRTQLPAGLLLYDALTALEATRTEMEEILGQEVLTLAEGSPIEGVERTPSPKLC